MSYSIVYVMICPNGLEYNFILKGKIENILIKLYLNKNYMYEIKMLTFSIILLLIVL